ncbi:MAG: DUF72 domain-containing protein [Candidatus Eisenbacteria bacterium]
MIFVGTSGYSFRDWVGPFYPEGTRNQDMLARYARVFPAVEINATYYRLPSVRTFEGMARGTPPGFRFVVKLSGSLTHGVGGGTRGRRRSPAGEVGGDSGSRPVAGSGALSGPESTTPVQESLLRDPAPVQESQADGGSVAEGCRAFLSAIMPLEDAGKLDGILAQFPYRFRAGPDETSHLEELRHRLGERPLFVEFRHESWARESTYRLLRELGVGFCVVDEPRLPGLFPPVVQQTNDVAYFRFHGRNAERWWDGDNSTRYDYLYDEAELREWAAKIHDTAARTRQTFVFFNNCHGGSAPTNAEQMQALLGQMYGAGSEGE